MRIRFKTNRKYKKEKAVFSIKKHYPVFTNIIFKTIIKIYDYFNEKVYNSVKMTITVMRISTECENYK